MRLVARTGRKACYVCDRQTEGIGKSTFAACAPKPVFVCTEDGLGEIDTTSFPLARSFDEVERSLLALHDGEHQFETAVIDSLDWLEQLIWDAVCIEDDVNSIEKVGGGYGKGYTESLIYWRRIMDLLNLLRDERHMAVVLISVVKRGKGMCKRG